MKSRSVLLTAALLLAALPAGAAGDKLTIKVSPALSFAPTNLIVRAYVTKDADNRAIEVVAESPDFYRSSEEELEGDKAPHTNVFEFKSLPSGTYEVTAVLIGTHGRRAEVRSEVNVLAAGGSN